jgi:multiple sugar transport system substrate-binding protein
MRSLVLTVLIIALTGCSSVSQTNSSATGTATGSSDEAKIVLDFPSWQAEEPGFSDWWKELISQFEQEHQNVNPNFESL